MGVPPREKAVLVKYGTVVAEYASSDTTVIGLTKSA